jgi:2-aminoadipate transaminase
MAEITAAINETKTQRMEFLNLGDRLDATAMLSNAVDHFVHGELFLFYLAWPERARLRMSFANASVEQIGEGFRRLARRIGLERVDLAQYIAHADQWS